MRRPGRPRALEEGEEAGDDDLQEVAPVDDDGEDLEAVLGLLLRVHDARVQADVGRRTRPLRADEREA